MGPWEFFVYNLLPLLYRELEVLLVMGVVVGSGCKVKGPHVCILVGSLNFMWGILLLTYTEVFMNYYLKCLCY